MSLIKLQQMIDGGKTYYYREQTAVIKSFDATRGDIEIMVEIFGKPQLFSKENEEKLGLFLACFHEVPVVHDAELPPAVSNLPANNKTQVLPEIYTESKQRFQSLTDVLMADIEKVRSDPGYVGQAKQVCNNVSAIINITKLQFQLSQNG